MVHNRGRRVNSASPNLQHEIVDDDAAIAALSVGLTNLILDIAKEVGDIILRLIIVDFAGRANVASTPNFVHCNLISKPKSEGVPVVADFNDPRYTVSSYGVSVGTLNVTDSYHWRQSLKIKVPATNDLYVSCLNRAGGQALCAYQIRLFWQSL